MWTNFIVNSKFSYLHEGHIPAEQLIPAIGSGTLIKEHYYCAFDLKKRDTFKGYIGPARPAMGLVNFDFDHESDPALALKDTVAFTQWLGITNIKIFYSGSKGFHVCVPENYFGLPHDEHLPSKLNSLAHHLKLTYPTLDTSVYNYARKFRLPGSIHPKTKLYKTELTTTELVTLTIPQIKQKAAKNSQISIVFEKDVKPLNQILYALSQANSSTGTKYQKGKFDHIFEKKEKHPGKPCIRTLLNTKIDEGGRHHASWVLICDLYKTNVPEPDAEAAMLAWCKLVDFDDTRTSQTLAILENVYAGSMYYSFGCSTPLKKQHCTDSCPLHPNYKKPKEYPFVSLNDLFTRPDAPRTWLVENLIKEIGTSIFTAQPKLGKSTVTRNIGLAVARGSPIWKLKTLQAGVIFFSFEEDIEEVKHHFRAMEAEPNLPIYVWDSRDASEIYDKIRHANFKYPHVKLFIVDTLFRVLDVADGNNYAEMSQCLEAFQNLAKELSIHIMVTHHSGKGKEGSTNVNKTLGSTAISGAFDNIISLDGETDADGEITARYLSTTPRYGKAIPKTALLYDPVSGYTTLGDSKKKSNFINLEKEVLAFLKEQREAMSLMDIRDSMGGKESYIRMALSALVKAGHVLGSGTGVKGNPRVYSTNPNAPSGNLDI